MQYIKRLSTMLLLCAATAMARQENSPQTTVQESVEVNVVALDASVTDRDGNPILGLNADDFIVEEEGKPVTVESADYFTGRRLLTGLESKAPFKVERVRQERHFIFFFHKEGADVMTDFYGEVLRAKQAAKSFIRDRMQQTDRVAVVGYDTRLKVFTDFTSDRKELLRALDEAATFSNGILENRGEKESSILANADLKEMRDDTGTVFEALEFLARAVRPIRGRKVLLLFSAGMGEPSRFDPVFIEDEAREFEPMMKELHTSNMTVFAMNLLRSQSRFSAREQLLARIADETGGEYYRNLVSFQTPLKQVDQQNAGYYLLTYTIQKKAGEHGFRKVSVRTRNPEFKVTARPGYTY